MTVMNATVDGSIFTVLWIPYLWIRPLVCVENSHQKVEESPKHWFKNTCSLKFFRLVLKTKQTFKVFKEKKKREKIQVFGKSVVGILY